jgi:hypothetical protein
MRLPRRDGSARTAARRRFYGARPARRADTLFALDGGADRRLPDVRGPVFVARFSHDDSTVLLAGTSFIATWDVATWDPARDEYADLDERAAETIHARLHRIERQVDELPGGARVIAQSPS